MLQLKSKAKEQQQKYSGFFSSETVTVVRHQQFLSTTLISIYLKNKRDLVTLQKPLWRN